MAIPLYISLGERHWYSPGTIQVRCKNGTGRVHEQNKLCVKTLFKDYQSKSFFY